MNSKMCAELLELEEEDTLFISGKTLITANNLIHKLHNTAKSNRLWWYPPLVSISNKGKSILLEWGNKTKKYTICISEDDILYYAFMGKSREEIEAGAININSNLTEFWEWIAE